MELQFSLHLNNPPPVAADGSIGNLNIIDIVVTTFSCILFETYQKCKC